MRDIATGADLSMFKADMYRALSIQACVVVAAIVALLKLLP